MEDDFLRCREALRNANLIPRTAWRAIKSSARLGGSLSGEADALMAQPLPASKVALRAAGSYLAGIHWAQARPHQLALSTAVLLGASSRRRWWLRIAVYDIIYENILRACESVRSYFHGNHGCRFRPALYQNVLAPPRRWVSPFIVRVVS